MKNILEKNNLLKPPKVGEIIEGKIIGKEKGAIFLDLGPFGTGIIYGKEFLDVKENLKNLKEGENIFAKIIDLENEDGYVELSISQAGKEITWQELLRKKESGEIISVKILGANKGGLLTEVSGIIGFLPLSQLSSEHYPKIENGDPVQILKELQKFIGKKMDVQIIDLDPKTQKLILSEKSKNSEKIKEALKNYKIGDIVEGKISGITDFGAFFQFNPLPSQKDDIKDDIKLEGLIHISELDWKLIESPAEIVKVGQKIKAKIIEIANGKIFLSLKALKKDPWEGLEKKYKKGDKIVGKVVKINPFGAFVQINSKIQALCHISEFGTKSKMEEKLKIGKEYDFEILEIRPQEHKMILKLIS